MEEFDNEKTSFYNHSDKTKTETYNNSENQRTGTYSSKQDHTETYTDPQSKSHEINIHGFKIGDKILLKNVEYQILSIISEGTGEAVIYKIENADKQIFALKLYFEFSNIKEEPNHETLKRIKNISDPYILKLYDYGVGKDKYKEKYCYEISDYAEGGDLFAVTNFKNKYIQEFIERNIIPEILNGILRLHKNKIYHCDLKPSNIFYKNYNQTDIVIGDYGSAKAYDLETEKEIRKSSTVKGTEAYLAPEQARGIISEKNDFYSLGIILLHLLYPEYLSDDNSFKKIDSKKYEKIVERQYNSQPIIDFNPSFGRINNLIEGLTLINHINRFGKKEVEKWINGENLDVKYKNIEISNIQTVKLGYATIKTDKDFIEILETRDSWWEELFEDGDTYLAIKGWLGSYHDISSRKIFDEMINYYIPFGKDYVKEAAIRYFSPNRDIRIDMNSFNFFTCEDINQEVERFIAKIDDIWKITSIEKLKFYFFQLEFSLQQFKFLVDNESLTIVNLILEKIYSAFGIIQKSFDNYKTEIQNYFSPKSEKDSLRILIGLFYIFNKNRTYKDLNNNSIGTLKALGIFYIQNDKKFYDKFLSIEKEFFLEKINSNKLCNLSFNDFVLYVFKDEVEISIKFLNFEVISEKECTVFFILVHSLNRFLIDNKINSKISFPSSEISSLKLETNFFSGFRILYKNFCKSLNEKFEVEVKNIFQQDLISFKKTFYNSYKTLYEINKKRFLSLFVFTISIVIYYFIQNLLDKNYKVSDGIFLFNKSYYFLLFGFSFSILSYGFIIPKFKNRKFSFLTISLVLLLILSFFIYNKIDFYNKTEEFQHNFYIEAFKPVKKELLKELNKNEFIKSIHSGYATYDNLKIINKNNKMIIKSRIPIVVRSVQDNGFFTGNTYSYQEVESNPFRDHYNQRIFYDVTELSNEYSIVLNAKILDSNSIIGLNVGDLTTLISRDMIKVVNEREFTKELKDKTETYSYYYAIYSNDPDNHYTQNRKYRPHGNHTEKLEPAEIIYKQSTTNKNNVVLEINISKTNYQAILNNEKVYNIEKINNGNMISLSLGFNSNIEIYSIKLYNIEDNRNIIDSTFSTFKPLLINSKNNFLVYKNKNTVNPIKTKIGTKFEVLFEANGYFTLKSLSDNQIFYTPISYKKEITF